MPLNPKNFSGPDKNITPFYRNDTVPTRDKAGKSPYMGRPKHTENNPHYRGDNVRNTFPNNPPKYESTGKRLSGILDFGINSDIWKFDDEQIRKNVSKQISLKYHVDVNKIDVIVYRNTGKVKYEYKYYLKSAKDDLWLDFVDLDVGEDFTVAEITFKDFPKIIQEKVSPKAVWIKLDSNSAKVLPGQKIVDYSGGNIRYTGFDIADRVKRVYKEMPVEKEPRKPQGVSFKDLQNGDGFIFVDMPKKLKDKGYKYDTVFEKVGEDKIKVDNKTYKLKNTFAEVTKVKDWESQYKYKPEDIERAFGTMLTKYKVSDTKYGKSVNLPSKDFYDILSKYNVSEAYFNSLSKLQGQNLVGNYVGKGDTYVWRVGDTEAVVTKLQ